MASLSVSVTRTSLYLSVSSPPAGIEQYAFQVDTHTKNTSSNGATFTDVDGVPVTCGTGYTCAAAYRIGTVWTTVPGSYGTWYTSSCPVYPGSPTISLSSYTNSDIIVNVTFGSNTSYVTVNLGGQSKNAFSSGTSLQFAGLSAGTAYTATCTAYNGDGSTSGNTLSLGTTPNPPSATFTAGVQSISASFSRDASADYVELYAATAGHNNLGWSYSSSGTVVLSSMIAGSSYQTYVRARGVTSGLYTNWIPKETIVPTAPIPLPSLPSVSASPSYNSVTVTVNFGANTDYVNVIICPDGSVTQIGDTQVVNSSGGSVTFSGLTTNTEYDIRYRAYNSQGSTSQEKIDTRTLAFGIFDWGVTLTSGASAIIYASKWNSIQDGINTKRTSKGLGTYSFTRAAIGNDIFASMANQLISSMSGIATGLPSSVSSGGAIYASWLSQIASSYNNIT